MLIYELGVCAREEGCTRSCELCHWPACLRKCFRWNKVGLAMLVLQFKGKTAVENIHHSVPHHSLEFDAKLSVLGKGDAPSLEGNLIIEGDNLLALKALLPTHAGRIKCIYIDPPYNTGEEEWVYNDNLTQPQFKEWIGQTVGKEGEDACRHDKWCCMMYPRLQLLKEMLTPDGVILVSIDENEIQNLRLLMLEIFGEENFLEMIVWQKSNGNGLRIGHSRPSTITNWFLLKGTREFPSTTSSICLMRKGRNAAQSLSPLSRASTRNKARTS